MESTASNSVCRESVYRELFQLHARRVRNFLYYKGAGAEEAEDLMQEAFLRLWRECERVPAEKAAAFLFTVAGNLFLDARKHDQVVLKFQRHAARQTTGVSAPSENPHAQLEHSETLDRIEAALAALPEGQRTVFLMNRMDGMTYNEIAQALELSVKAIEKRMSLALKSLRQALKNRD
ncbi:MAG: RNA polymerase subunit sigma-70 [Saprospirales bacterium]|jgi:RNA polymerase sigma-70 factor (ECF subfamily)|nr:RNA polymerase subunit sigma-70 [Saprospirales bacterium]